MLSKTTLSNMTISKCLLSLTLLMSGQMALASSPAYQLTNSADLTISFGAEIPEQPLARENLRVFVWNIHKAADDNMYKDFAGMATEADLALFQESISSPHYVQQITAAVPYFGWTMAKSFQLSNADYTGVATGSRVKPLREEVLVSTVREGLVSTPKTILVSEYAVEGSAQTLLVANIHGINFVGPGVFKYQIRQLVDKIKDHKGPLVVAGDFNTWDMDRMQILKVFFAPVGLRKLKTPVAGLFDLDHIFVRGMEARTIHDFSHVKSSDHAPLMVDLYFLSDF